MVARRVANGRLADMALDGALGETAWPALSRGCLAAGPGGG
jgi:hypothetical protein